MDQIDMKHWFYWRLKFWYHKVMYNILPVWLAWPKWKIVRLIWIRV